MLREKADEERCPKCNNPLLLLKILEAAKLVGVSQKTIYGYVEEGSVYAVKVAGKRLRICKGCLIRPYTGE
jgi:excisionase family DNA binding protein